MNKDMVTGILVSITIHCATFLGFNHKAPPPPKPVIKEEPVMQFEMPPPEEEEPDKVQDLVDDQQQNVIVPPSLVDLPTVVPVTAFTQPLQPPPPPRMSTAKGAINIPVTKPGANFGKGVKDLFDIKNLDQKPVALLQDQPVYPAEMSREGINGEVAVEFILNTSGDVVETRVVRSSRAEFEAPAIAAVKKWKFRPGKKGGKAVNVRAAQLIKFDLQDIR